MPQLMPMNWCFSFIMIFIFLMICVFIYFEKNNMCLIMNKKMLMFKLNWKW